MENLPDYLKNLLNNVESKKPDDGNVSSPEKGEKDGKEIPPGVKMDMLIEEYVAKKLEIDIKQFEQFGKKPTKEEADKFEKDLEKIINKLHGLIASHPELKEDIDNLNTEIRNAADKYNKADGLQKEMGEDPERAVLKEQYKEEMLKFGSRMRALKKIRESFFKKAPESDEDEEE